MLGPFVGMGTWGDRSSFGAEEEARPSLTKQHPKPNLICQYCEALGEGYPCLYSSLYREKETQVLTGKTWAKMTPTQY